MRNCDKFEAWINTWPRDGGWIPLIVVGVRDSTDQILLRSFWSELIEHEVSDREREFLDRELKRASRILARALNRGAAGYVHRN